MNQVHPVNVALILCAMCMVADVAIRKERSLGSLLLRNLGLA